MAGVLRLSHIGLCVSDLERSLAFYRALGFRERSRLRMAGGPAEQLLELEAVDLSAIYLERDGTRLELLHYPSPGHVGGDTARPMNALGLTHLSLRVDDLDAVAEALLETGGRLLEASRTEIPAARTRALFAVDPDGTRIELVEAPGDPDALPGQG
jgi:catechol 2,3-dioxygenase-like lactoylglutathione lyase family enzyme